MTKINSDCPSLTQFRLLAALLALSSSQGKTQETLRLEQKLQDIVDSLSENIQNIALKTTLWNELRKISLHVGAGVVFPVHGQVYALLRSVEGNASDRIRILWTPDAGNSDELMLKQDGKVVLRRQRILRLFGEAAQQGAAPTKDEIAAVLEVSVRTIRSDLQALQAMGHTFVNSTKN